MSLAFDPSSVFGQAIEDHLAVIDSLRDQQSLLQGIGEEMTRAILAGKKVLWCGNGGSAADSQHLAAELMGRFRRERCAIALNCADDRHINFDRGRERLRVRKSLPAPSGGTLHQGRRAGRYFNFRLQQERLCRAANGTADRCIHGRVYRTGRRGNRRHR